jgi:ABC-type antimicrobial peptide transport system permease subunit
MARTSFTLVMLGIAAATALLLGVVGIYGAIAYMVIQRTREIGVRVALGAQHGQIRRRFVGHGMALAAIGIGVGLAASVGLTRFMASLLFGISPVDGTTYAAVALVLLTASALASYIPAHRATSIDPIDALRADS